MTTPPAKVAGGALGDADDRIGVSISVLMCDDVRTEASGKTIYIGAYGGTLVVSHLPCILPQLCFVLTVESDIDAVPMRMEFAFEFPGQPAADLLIVERPQGSPPGIYPSDARYHRSMFTNTMSQPILAAAGRLKIRSTVDGVSKLLAVFRIEEQLPPGTSADQFAEAREEARKTLEMRRAKMAAQTA